MYTYLKKNYLYIIFIILFSIINIYSIISTLNANNITYNNKLLALIILISYFIMIVFIIFLNKFNKIKEEKLFLYLAIPIGLIYMVLIPVGLVPDEHTHFARAYEISEFHLVSDINTNGVGGRELPIEVNNNLMSEQSRDYKQYISNLTAKNSGKEDFISFTNTSLYSFICYLPQSIGILFGRIFQLPTLIDAYLGRVFNFALFILLIYLSIKLIPFMKKEILLLALLPMTMQEGISLSPDAMTIGCSFLLLSYVLYLKNDKEKKITNKEFALLSIISIVLSLCKIVYLPICLLLFLIPKEKFNSKKDKIIKIVGLAIFVIIINLIWIKVASRFLEYDIRPGVNTSDQITFILHYPIEYIKVMGSTTLHFGRYFVFSALGTNLELLDLLIAKKYLLINIIFTILLLFVDKNVKLEKKNKLMFVFISLSTILLIYTSIYLQWNPVGNSIIEGLQGRYFMPLLPLILLLFAGIKYNEKIASQINKYLYTFILFQSFYVLTIILFNNL